LHDREGSLPIREQRSFAIMQATVFDAFTVRLWSKSPGTSSSSAAAGVVLALVAIRLLRHARQSDNP
jgi:hypothetical protein